MHVYAKHEPQSTRRDGQSTKEIKSKLNSQYVRFLILTQQKRL